MNELSKLEMRWLMLKAFNREKEKANLKITLYDCKHIALMEGQNHERSKNYIGCQGYRGRRVSRGAQKTLKSVESVLYDITVAATCYYTFLTIHRWPNTNNELWSNWYSLNDEVTWRDRAPFFLCNFCWILVWPYKKIGKI